MILLEYHQKQGFHNNTIICNEGRFNSPLFSYGWKPVCIIPDRLKYDPAFEALIDKLEAELPEYETVVHEIVFWVMKTLEAQESES